MKTAARIKKFQYYALDFSQRGAQSSPKFILFHAPASEIIEWADVDRLEPKNPTGAQRPLRELKVKKVARFLDADGRNTIPTAIVVALDDDAVSFSSHKDQDGRGSHGRLTIKMKGRSKPGLIIDGQHRAFGLAKHSGTLHLNVVAFLGGDDAERAFQFVVINNSATRVTKDHIRALNLSYNKDTLNNRLLKSAGVSLGMKDAKYEDFQYIDNMPPFKGLLQWPTNEAGFIAPNAIESALAETKDRAALLGIEDLEREFFLAIWARVKARFGGAWREDTAGHRSHLLQKVAIWALTVYLLDSLEAAQRMSDAPIDFANDEILRTAVDRVLNRIPIEFWITEWRAKELDTSQGRQSLLDALKAIDSNVRFDRPWYDRVTLIDPGDLDEQYDRSQRGRTSKKMKKSRRRS
jgi:DGQHR domain-containing protein